MPGFLLFILFEFVLFRLCLSHLRHGCYATPTESYISVKALKLYLLTLIATSPALPKLSLHLSPQSPSHEPRSADTPGRRHAAFAIFFTVFIADALADS